MSAPRVARIATSISLNLILRRQMDVLAADGFEISCVCDDDDWASELRAKGFDVRPIGMGRRPTPSALLRWAWLLWRDLRRRPVDVVHTHNAFHGIVGRLVARLAGVPVVVQTVHNWWYLDPALARRARLYRTLERLAARASDAVLFTNSDDVRRAAEERIVPAGKCRFIGNGVDVADLERRLAESDRLAKRRELGLEKDDVAVTMVARLERPKDHATLLEGLPHVLEAVPRTRLLLVGYGLEQDAIEEHVERLGLAPFVRFLGYRDDVVELLDASDAVVLSSHQEGFGRCLVEAMVAGVPVVASDVVGVRDVVEDGVNGLLVPPGDATGLADALVRALTDADLRGDLVTGGRRSLQRFDERPVALRIGEIYRELLSAKSVERGADRRLRAGRWGSSHAE